MLFHQYGLVWNKSKNVSSVLFFPFVFRLYHFLRFFQLGLLLTNGKPSLLSQCLPHCSHRTQLLALSFLPSFCPFRFWSAYAKQCPQLFLASRFCVRLFKESHHKRLIKSIPLIQKVGMLGNVILFSLSSFFWLWERREGRSWVFLWAKLYFASAYLSPSILLHDLVSSSFHRPHHHHYSFLVPPPSVDIA